MGHSAVNESQLSVWEITNVPSSFGSDLKMCAVVNGMKLITKTTIKTITNLLNSKIRKVVVMANSEHQQFN
jgi:hypothetical protein